MEDIKQVTSSPIGLFSKNMGYMFRVYGREKVVAIKKVGARGFVDQTVQQVVVIEVVINNRNIASSSGIPRNITSNSASDMIPSSSSTIPPNTVIASDEPSPLIRMSSGKRKLVRKRRNLTPIPIIDLTTDDDNEFADIIDQHLKGVSKGKIIGCRTCSAKLWKAEADRGEQKRNKPNYFLCCSYGKVLLPDFKQPPEILKDLYVGVSAKSKFFLKNIRRYNSMFSFTSMGGRIDKTINRGNAPYVFRLSGQNYHTIGSLLPEDGNDPKFSQLYIYDTDNEIFNRQNAVGGSNTSFTITESAFDVQIIEELTLMLDTNNALVKIYRQARNCLNENPYIDLKLCLIGKRSKDGRTYNLPEASEVAALVIGDLTQAVENRDIVVKRRSGRIERISELHPSYLSLQYPLLFPYGEDMYRVDILHRGLNPDTNSKRPMCTMREFFAYRLQDRVDKFSLIHNAKRLFQQFVVDAYTMIESERLFYIRRQQTHLRSETVQNIQNASNAGKKDMSKIGTRIFIPSSFTGGSRYMMQNYLDAMSLCKWFGYPDFFITITCNPKWPEVQRFLKDTTIRPEDRPDILCRIFKIKLDSITKELKEGKLLGRVNSDYIFVVVLFSGMPNHKLVLKVGVPIMLLRNLDQKNGLCNGTRLQVVKLGDRIIEAKVISGNNIGTRTFIPRINLSPSDKRIPFKLQRRQFPIAVCFAMTINKSQGQSLSKVGLFLKQPVFTHGQLYVAVSRVKSMDGLRMLILDVEGNVTNKTTNVVYKEIFSNL
ncbi:uncharacterized protein LOC118485895 [Helianthus annuus]|uniref:uncharacterized protein LOC118485895 n=1 Tax=Helianthus annuus TaxID=4232 RepID=UPI001652E181|nr:uncharacterized protein LOC118485895 [Helianthus annuus]